MRETVLDALKEHVGPWARAYVALCEALVREGVPEATAREEARVTATEFLFETLQREPGDPPW